MKNYTIQLYGTKGFENWDGDIFKEDRYIVINTDNYDVTGEHFDKETAQAVANDMNKEEEL